MLDSIDLPPAAFTFDRRRVTHGDALHLHAARRARVRAAMVSAMYCASLPTP